jgi:ribosomal protein S6E (S10)
MDDFIYHPEDGRNLARITEAMKVFSTVTGKEIGFVKDGVVFNLSGARVCALTIAGGGSAKGGEGANKLAELANES